MRPTNFTSFPPPLSLLPPNPGAICIWLHVENNTVHGWVLLEGSVWEWVHKCLHARLSVLVDGKADLMSDGV